MFRGRVFFSRAMLWFLGFILIFTTGGMTGILMSVPAADFQVHNSLFLIAHFHSMVIGGVLFGLFSGLAYWFPKFMGFKLNEKLGRYAFWCWIVGFFFAFMPLYVAGLMGATRRLDHYDEATGWQPLFIIAGIGVAIIITGVLLQVLQIIIGVNQRLRNKVNGDPWNGRTLEWSIPSPPPFYNFATIPVVNDLDPYWAMKQKEHDKHHHHYLNPREIEYEEIHMPKNTAMGLYISGFAFLFSFGAIWYITWLALFGLAGVIICLIIRLSNDNIDYYLPASEVKRIEIECAERMQNV
jgi:cytochrome o ubiquinol oxidase subunit 1